ncbi:MULTISPECIES: glycosyltransferase [Citricoccus]|uniref:glycosyltransferase n=1 Tax=Citricoccus TaxID=169133 RepID=UPI000255EF5A|nr:glycosyltransferase [Citricoccus sp. CH26A]
MRIIVCLHDMEVGGSQLNALDLAAAIRDRGHHVMLYASPGPLMDRVHALGLDLTLAGSSARLSVGWAAGLLRLARSWRADVVHTYDWGPSIGASFGAHGLIGIPQVMTVPCADVPRFLPRHLDLIVGSRKLWADTGDHPRRHLMAPPVDTIACVPTDPWPARRSLGLSPEDLVISLVGQMTTDLDQAAGVIAAIAHVDRLAEREPAVLLIGGGGPELVRIRAAARRVNTRHGRRVVLATGSLPDPSPAYAAADVVLGMGGSVLRGMAYAKPAIVLGADGFCEPVTRRTMTSFDWQGFYGVGDGGEYGLLPHLLELAADAAERRRRGEWSRAMVEEHHSLRRAALLLENIYGNALGRRHGLAERAGSLARSAAELGSFLTHRVLAGRPAV